MAVPAVFTAQCAPSASGLLGSLFYLPFHVERGECKAHLTGALSAHQFNGERGAQSLLAGCCVTAMLLSSMTLTLAPRPPPPPPPPPSDLPMPPPPPPLLPACPPAAPAAAPPPFRRRLVSGMSCISFCMHSHSPSSAVTARLVPCSAHLQAGRQAGGVIRASSHSCRAVAARCAPLLECWCPAAASPAAAPFSKQA